MSVATMLRKMSSACTSSSRASWIVSESKTKSGWGMGWMAAVHVLSPPVHPRTLPFVSIISRQLYHQRPYPEKV